jgi:hypothetical protein
LNVDSELQKLEAILAALEKESYALQQTLKAIPHTSVGRAEDNALRVTRETPSKPGHKVHHEIFPHVSGDEGNLS